MSFDMDIWNGEHNYFSDDLLISLEKSPFLNIQMWVNRSNFILKIVDEFIRRTDEFKKLNPPQKHWNWGSDHRRYDKRMAFHKKQDNEKVGHQKPKNLDQQNRNMDEMFPPLEEANRKNNGSHKNAKPAKEESPHLLDTLMASLPKIEQTTDPKKKEKGIIHVKPVEPHSKPADSTIKTEAPLPQKNEKQSTPKTEDNQTRNNKTQETRKKQVSERQDGNDQKGDNMNQKNSKAGLNAAVSQSKDSENPTVKTDAFCANYIEKTREEKAQHDKEKTANIKNMLGLNF